MKNAKCTLLIVALCLTATFIKAQIKVFTGGSVSIGSTSSPATNNVNHQVVGSKIYFPSSTSTPTSAALIRGNVAYSSASTPDYTWWGNDQAGFFHPTSNVIGITINGSEKFRFNNSGQILNSNSSSSASTPDFSWNSDANTGIFSAGGDRIGFSTGGTERMRITEYGNILVGTTSTEVGKINTVSSNGTGGYFKATYTSDWGPPTVEAETDRVNSANYRVTLTGTGTNFYVSGGGWVYNVGGIYNASDKNLKDDIAGIDSAMSKVLQLNGVTYKLKKEKQNPNLYPTPQEYMGVIAQDVEKVAPQAVKIVHDGTKAVNYEMLIGLLIEALKEQNSKINQLQNDVNNCCSKNQRFGNPSNGNDQGNLSNPNNDYQSGIAMANSSFIKQNSPNPFNKETAIEYFIAERNASSSILIFDMNGKLLKTLQLSHIGKGTVIISGNDFQPGMYYYSLIVNQKEIDTKKMILTE